MGGDTPGRAAGCGFSLRHFVSRTWSDEPGGSHRPERAVGSHIRGPGAEGSVGSRNLEDLGIAVSASHVPSSARVVARTDSSRCTAAAAGERILQRCSPQGIQTYPDGQSAAGSNSERRGGSVGRASGRRWPREADRRRRRAARLEGGGRKRRAVIGITQTVPGFIL